MTNKEKGHLQWTVRCLLGDGKTDKEIIQQLHRSYGYQKATIRKYIKAFTKTETKKEGQAGFYRHN